MPDRADLPLADYDHMPEGNLAHRIRSLHSDELQQLIDYEREHGNRLPVLQMLEARQEDLAAGAEPSPGDQEGQPGGTPPTRHGSPVSPGGAGDPGQPLRHGVAGQTPHRD